jgi:hypothetical protein
VILLNKFALGIIAVSAVLGIGLAGLTDSSDSGPKTYSFTAEELCDRMGYDLAYEFDSTDDVVSCGSWHEGMSDSKVNLNVLFTYAGENPEKFDNNFTYEYR